MAKLIDTSDLNLRVPSFSSYKMQTMPAPLTGVLGRKLINFLKLSLARAGTYRDPVKKVISLAVQEGASSVRKGVLGRTVSSTDSISATV